MEPQNSLMGQGILNEYLAKTPASAWLALRAKEVLAGGVVSDTRIFDPYGIYVDRAEGVRKWDVDGNVYLDLFGGHGANMLGHAHPVVVDAVREAVGRGVQYAANHAPEVDLAAEVVRHVPSAELVRFAGSGTEATLLAIRLARAFTGRTRIVRIAAHYHGWHDSVASGYAGEFDGGAAPGILDEIAAQTILVRPGDVAGLAAAVDQHGSEIAAFIAEPLGTHFGVVPLQLEFLRMMNDYANDIGALFILDEVLSGFRVAMGGYQAITGLRPHLTTLAKVLCGGMPGGAVVGSADVMNMVDADAAKRKGRAKVLHQGTFTGNPVSMLAGLAALKELERIDGCATANRLGALARSRLNAMSRDQRLPFAWYGNFSIFHLLVRDDGGYGDEGVDFEQVPMATYLARPQPILNRLRMALNVVGVDVNVKGSGLFSAAHSEGDVDFLVEKVAEAGDMLRRDQIVA